MIKHTSTKLYGIIGKIFCAGAGAIVGFVIGNVGFAAVGLLAGWFIGQFLEQSLVSE